MDRDKILYGRTHKIKCGCGNMYITVNRKRDGKIWEVSIKLGKAGGCAASQSESIGRLLTRLSRSNVGIDKVIKDLRGNVCHTPAYHKGKEIKSCSDAIGIALEEELEWEATDEFKKFLAEDEVDPVEKQVCQKCGSED